MSLTDWLKEQAAQIKSAGLETIEAVGEGAVAGITDAIRGGTLSGASATDQVNNAPDIGVSGDGRRTVTSQPVGNQYQAPGFIQGMPTWAKVVGGGSVLLLVTGVVLLAVRGAS